MHRRLQFLLCAVLPAASLGFGQPLLHLKTRNLNPSAQSLSAPNQARFRRDPHRSHQVVQFAHPPGPADVAELRQRGATVLQYVPDNGLLIAAGDNVRLDGMGLLWSGALSAGDKLSPLLATPAALRAGAYAVVEFYPDVDSGGARSIVLNLGLELVDRPDLVEHQLLVKGRLASLRALANWDEVAYIFPASADLVAGRPVMGCAGAVTSNGTVGAYIALVGDGWDGPGQSAAALRYFFSRTSDHLPPDTAKSEILRALNEWAKYAKLSFTAGSLANGPQTINILFARGDHGDGYPFDGPGKVLAHTFYPAPPNPESIAGDMHFDDDEGWRIGADVDVFSVALHEAGHALGLGHSDRPGAVMYPYYTRQTGLSADDIAAILSLYAAQDGTAGAPNGGDTPTPPITPPTPPPTPPAPPTPPTPPTPKDTTAPSLTVLSPASTTYFTAASTIVIRGTARDNVRVDHVAWSVSTGRSGNATGTTSWTTPAIPLATGANMIVIRAYDAAGNSSWRSLVVTRR